MSRDHKASDADVKQRVIANGGFILNNRINGILGAIALQIVLEFLTFYVHS